MSDQYGVIDDSDRIAAQERRDFPVIFSAPMVNAILREVREPGTGKTETRRLLYADRVAKNGIIPASATVHQDHRPPPCEFGHYWALTGWHHRKPGDRLWVRENWKPHSLYADRAPRDIPHGTKIFYAADDGYSPSNTKTLPSIHMPRWASRLSLIVTGVRVERLQNISQDAARAEGVDRNEKYPELYRLYSPLPGNAPGLSVTAFPKNSFWSLWQSLHGPGSWEANPWVVAVQFRPVLANIDAPEAKAA